MKNLEWFYRNYEVFSDQVQWWAVWEGMADDDLEADAWLMAERNDDSAPEEVVSHPDGGSNVAYVAPASFSSPNETGTADSRERLEADVMEYYTHTTSTAMWPESANIKTRWISVPMDKVCGWLDRQAAITERDAFMRGRASLDDEFADMQEQVDDLTAERDYWKDQVHQCVIEAVKPGGYTAGIMRYPRTDGYCEPSLMVTDAIDSLKDFYADEKRMNDKLTADLEAAHAKNRSLKAHIGKMQDGRHVWHERAEALQAKVDRLERENESLARDLAECERDREVYRMALGDARRLAHEIARIEAGAAS